MIQRIYLWFASLLTYLFSPFLRFDFLRLLDRFETLLGKLQATVLGWFGYHVTFKTYERGGILITGAGSGIGAHAAVMLAEKGFIVFAGSESLADTNRLKNYISAENKPNLIPILLNVTDPIQIEQAFMSVSTILEDRSLPLIGLVNAAGVHFMAPMEAMSQQDWIALLHANTVGPFGVIQTFLPLIRFSQGRIVNVSSVTGLTASPMNGGFAASKMAMEAATDALRVEVFRWGISVSLIEPGSINTRSRRGSSRRPAQISVPLSHEQSSLYSPLIRSVNEIMSESHGHSLSTRYTTKAITHALLSKHPHTRYLVGMDAKMTSWLRWLFSDRILDWGYQLLMDQESSREDDDASSVASGISSTASSLPSLPYHGPQDDSLLLSPSTPMLRNRTNPLRSPNPLR